MAMRTLFTKIIHEKHHPEEVLYEPHVYLKFLLVAILQKVK